MGLDTVEIILETEQRFAIELPDAECATILSVGDLYRLVLRKLDLPYAPAKDVEPIGFARQARFLSSTWSIPDAWCTLKSIIIEQLQVDGDEVRESARFRDDLGCD